MKKFKTIISNPLFSGSAVMIIGSNLANLINYIYHLIMGRILGPASYAELVSLLSLIGLLGILPSSLNLVIVKYVSSAKKLDDITGLLKWLSPKVYGISLFLSLLIFVSSSLISSFLNLANPSLVLILSFIPFFILPTLFNRSILQGLVRFKQMIMSILIEYLVKLILGVSLVYLGFSVSGAVGALVVASFFGWFITRQAISDYTKKSYKQTLPIPKLSLNYSMSVLFQSIAMVSLISSDLILVKHFFSSYNAGIYAAISTLSKIIFFGAGPIGAVMFPLIANKQAQGKSYKKIFLYSLFFTLILSILIMLIYSLIPQLAITLLYGSLYIEGSSLLISFGLFITLYTISSLLISFNLSRDKTRVFIFPCVAAIMQIMGIWFFHQSLMSVVLVSILVNALLLISLLIYSSYEKESTWYKFNFSNSTDL